MILISTANGVAGACSATNGDGGTETATEIDASVASDEDHNFALEYLSGSIKFYIDNSLEATHTTNKPDDC